MTVRTVKFRRSQQKACKAKVWSLSHENDTDSVMIVLYFTQSRYRMLSSFLECGLIGKCQLLC